MTDPQPNFLQTLLTWWRATLGMDLSTIWNFWFNKQQLTPEQQQAFIAMMVEQGISQYEAEQLAKAGLTDKQKTDLLANSAAGNANDRRLADLSTQRQIERNESRPVVTAAETAQAAKEKAALDAALLAEQARVAALSQPQKDTYYAEYTDASVRQAQAQSNQRAVYTAPGNTVTIQPPVPKVVPPPPVSPPPIDPASDYDIEKFREGKY